MALQLVVGLMRGYRSLSVVRVLLELKTEIADGETTGPSTVYREKLRASSAVQVAPRKHFLLFATFLGFVASGVHSLGRGVSLRGQLLVAHDTNDNHTNANNTNIDDISNT